MTTPALFATYLHDAMSARRMPPEEFEHELVGVRREEIMSWLDGSRSPDLDQVPTLARALRREPVEVAAAWLVDRLPELHTPLYVDVLEPRSSLFPAPDDLAVRARMPRKSELPERMDVDDPHDAERPTEPASVPERKARKRPLTRAR